MSVRRGLVGLIASLVAAFALPLVGTPGALALEYRLEVVSIYDDAFSYFLSRREYVNGASGPGLDSLEQAIDRQDFPKGVLLYDRPLQPADEISSRAYGASPVRAEVRRGGGPAGLWDEVRWEGKPGQRTVWLVVPSTPHTQAVFRVALKGRGALRQFQPYPPRDRVPEVVVRFPLGFLWNEIERGTLWEKFVSHSVDLRDGIAAVIAENDNPLFGDRVYLIVDQGESPVTYKAVLVWRRRPNSDRGRIEAPGAIGRQ